MMPNEVLLEAHSLLDNRGVVNHHFMWGQERIRISNAESWYKQTLVGRRVSENHNYLRSKHRATFPYQCVYNSINCF